MSLPRRRGTAKANKRSYLCRPFGRARSVTVSPRPGVATRRATPVRRRPEGKAGACGYVLSCHGRGVMCARHAVTIELLSLPPPLVDDLPGVQPERLAHGDELVDQHGLLRLEHPRDHRGFDTRHP